MVTSTVVPGSYSTAISSKCGHEADFLQSLFVLLHVFVRLGRALVIVEGHAGRDDVEHHRALVCDRGFKHGAAAGVLSPEKERPTNVAPS